VADIFHDFVIQAPIDRVFQAVSTPQGLDCWWTQKSAGEAAEGNELELYFGPGYDWRAKVTRSVAPSDLELEMVRADDDWKGTRVGFHLENRQESTQSRFYHTGWPHENEHWRVSCYCWAMYLRLLRRYLEHGEIAPYERRLEA